MIGEFNFLGMSFPWLFLTSLLSFGATGIVRLWLARQGLYRHIWHPALFDLALFVIVLGLSISVFSFSRF
ncbi:MAG: efflux system rane protein [Burkholderiaceae bacterium]|nr:efflux system rane protein [Burkholderiaceae bacterium]